MESLNDALIACVKALGGSKQVGPILWPEKAPDHAQRALLDCLNEDRPAKLCPEQVMLILKLSRAKGVHIGIDFILAQLGYSPAQPIEPVDEAAELLRHFNESVARQAELLQRMERVAGRLNLKAVA